ncbi:hypothetical protein BT96DRAFT_982977 [Gymnopus androsaceus JB14]|uniref:Uncharacterized protein n=1 Tax=Gymnopus androsaceus JB14 TaxID=1447944 RepID=A0A6A4IL31_9AGAR|nr:hypothetical protein BT96DRAFT_982977 [Gymnopus androsaceus JB14]
MSQSNFNPLERREWQSRTDRLQHNLRLDLLRRGWRSYPEVQERFHRALENIQIAIERTDMIYHSQTYPSLIKNWIFRTSYREYEMCFQRLVEESEVFAESCDEYEQDHPELSHTFPKTYATTRGRAGRHCQIDITVGGSSVDIKVQGEGSVDIRVKQRPVVSPPPYVP